MRLRLVDRWWCPDPPARHIHLRHADGLWRIVTTIGDSPAEEADFSSEAEARAAAEAFIELHPGQWIQQGR